MSGFVSVKTPVRIVTPELRALDKARAKYRRTYSRLSHAATMAPDKAAHDRVMARLAKANAELKAAEDADRNTRRYL